MHRNHNTLIVAPYTLLTRKQLTDILLPCEKHSVLGLDSVAFTLKLLGAPIEPIFEASTDHMFLRIAFLVIVNCVNVFIG